MKAKHLIIVIVIALIVGVILGGISKLFNFDISPVYFAALIPVFVGVYVAISIKKNNDK